MSGFVLLHSDLRRPRPFTLPTNLRKAPRNWRSTNQKKGKGERAGGEGEAEITWGSLGSSGPRTLSVLYAWAGLLRPFGGGWGGVGALATKKGLDGDGTKREVELPRLKDAWTSRVTGSQRLVRSPEHYCRFLPFHFPETRRGLF